MKHKYWPFSILFIYTLCLYLLIPYARGIQSIVESILGNGLDILLTGLLAFIFILLSIRMIRCRNYFYLFRILLGGLICIVSFNFISLPIEKVHFLFYAVWGHLALYSFLALLQNSLKAYAISLILGILAGWCDELIQAMTPNRIYDPWDIFFNGVGVFIGLMTYRAVWGKEINT